MIVVKNRVLFVLFGIASLALATGCSVTTQFRIKNATGQDVTVTSAQTKEAIGIADGASRLIPHTAGNVTVTYADGNSWLYKNLSPLQFRETSFATFKKHLYGSSITVDLLLAKDGRVYVMPAKAKDFDAQKSEQPAGFPIVPSEYPR